MDRKEFLENIEELLQPEESLNFNTPLDDLNEWDSLSKMSVIAFLDKNFGIKITFNDLNQFVTVEDIAKKAGL